MKTSVSAKILVIIFAVLCGGCAAFSFSDAIPDAFRARTSSDPTGSSPSLPSSSTTDVTQIGDLVVSQGIDQDGCATESITTFESTDSIYVVLQDSAFPAGTTFFARLYDEDRALEDTNELTADQDYSNVCVNFVFDSDVGWAAGSYQIEMFVNGNSYQAVDFTVR